FTTSGPCPLVTAVWIRVCSSFQPITSRSTLTPVCLVNSLRIGVSTSLSLSRLVPWLLAQYVIVADPPSAPPPAEPLPEHPASAIDTTAIAAAAATTFRFASTYDSFV